jgi:hypothetical protein
MPTPNSAPNLFGEVIPPPAISEQTIGSRDALYMANGFQKMEEGTLIVDGAPRLLDVVATARINGYSGEVPTELIFTKEPGGSEGTTTLHQVRRTNEDVVSVRALDFDDREPFQAEISGASDGYPERNLRVEFEPTDTRHKGWSSLRITGQGNSRGITRSTVTVSEAAHPVRETNIQAERRAKRSKRRLVEVGAVTVALALTGATAAAKWGYNELKDGGNDAATYVENTFHNGSNQVHDSEDAVGDSSNTDTEQTTTYNKAVSRVAQTMEDLDNHDYAAVVARSDKYRADHAEEFKSEKELQTFQKRLDSAKSTDQVVGVVNEFLKGYMSEARIATDIAADRAKSADFRDQAKTAGQKIIDDLGHLPGPMVRGVLGYDKSLDFLPQNYDEALRFHGIEFSFQSHKNTLGHSVGGWDGARIRLDDNKMPGNDIEKTLMHEFTHGVVDEGSVVDSANAGDGSLKTEALNIASHVVGKPLFTSEYATTSGPEETAESGADIFVGKLANPDNVLNFTSRANRTRLAVLIKLEEKYRGIIDYLITQFNSQLLQK